MVVWVNKLWFIHIVKWVDLTLTVLLSYRLSHYQTSLCITKRFDTRFICVIKNEVIMKGSPTALLNSVEVL